MVGHGQQPSAGIGKGAMRAFLGLLVVNAVVAIGAILGATGESDWEVVGTTLLLTAGCLTVAANAAAVERKRLMWLPLAGAVLSCLAFAFFIFLIWVEPGSDGFALKTSFILLTIGLSATYASVLSLPHLESVFATARLVSYATVALLAVLTVGVILAEGGVSGQVYAVLSVVLATATIIVLVGAIIDSRNPATPSSVDAVSEGTLFCPACTAALPVAEQPGRYLCSGCGLGFTLQITSPPTGRAIGH